MWRTRGVYWNPCVPANKDHHTEHCQAIARPLNLNEEVCSASGLHGSLLSRWVSVSAGSDNQLKPILMQRCTEKTVQPLPDSHAQMRRYSGLRPIWDCYSPGKPETNFSTYLKSILLPLLYKSQASSLMKKVLCTLALPFLCFNWRYRWLYLIVSLQQSNLLKRSKQNTGSQIHRWYNSIDFSSITPGIDPALTAFITGKWKRSVLAVLTLLFNWSVLFYSVYFIAINRNVSTRESYGIKHLNSF